MIPNLDPPIQTNESIHIPFDEHDPKAMLTVELLTDMYVGLEFPVMTFSREGVTTLVIPRTINRVFPARNES